MDTCVPFIFSTHLFQTYEQNTSLIVVYIVFGSVCLSVCSLIYSLVSHVWGLTFCTRAQGPMVVNLAYDVSKLVYAFFVSQKRVCVTNKPRENNRLFVSTNSLMACFFRALKTLQTWVWLCFLHSFSRGISYVVLEKELTHSV